MNNYFFFYVNVYESLLSVHIFIKEFCLNISMPIVFVASTEQGAQEIMNLALTNTVLSVSQLWVEGQSNVFSDKPRRVNVWCVSYEPHSRPVELPAKVAKLTKEGGGGND